MNTKTSYFRSVGSQLNCMFLNLPSSAQMLFSSATHKNLQSMFQKSCVMCKIDIKPKYAFSNLLIPDFAHNGIKCLNQDISLFHKNCLLILNLTAAAHLRKVCTWIKKML